MRLGCSQDFKDRQSAKIKELSDALIAAGFYSLDAQALALGLSRSTTWTILRAKHKNYGLSGALINRILEQPGLDRCVRAKIAEYVEEKVSGHYGHNRTQLRRFRQRLTAQAKLTTTYRKMFAALDAASPTAKKRDWPRRPET